MSDIITVTASNNIYIHGRERFLQEAKNLAKFNEEPGVVGVRDVFEANNTAYIVMEYLDGITLKTFVETYGRIPAEKLFRVFRPMIQSLGKVHNQSIIHRDISPDNIMVLRNGTLKLLDFGAAREVSGERSLSIMLKPGYAPYEQYRSTGNQGPWTDIYALCSTMYFCLTGIRPEPSVDRMENDTIKRPSELGVRISQSEESVILRGMALRVRDRYKTIQELAAAFFKDAEQKKKSSIDFAYTEQQGCNPPVFQKQEDQHTANSYAKQDSIRLKSGKTQHVSHHNRITPLVVVAAVCIALLSAMLLYFFNRETLRNKNETAGLKNSEDIAAASLESGESNPKKAIQRISELASAAPMRNISIGDGHAVAIRQDGTVVAAGDNSSNQCEVSDWRNVVAVETGDACTFGIGKNGYAIAVGDNKYGQFDERWEYLKDISANSNHVVGLRENGTVVALGENEYGECDTNEWKDIIAISAGWKHTVGLRADGTVVAVGANNKGQCDVNDWFNIVAISAGSLHTVGLTADGHVLATGNNVERECNVQDWSDIIAIDAGNTHTVGIRADGTAVAVGTNIMGECNIGAWTDLIAISAGGSTTLGLRRDGEILYTSSWINTPWYGIKTIKELPDESLRSGVVPDGQSSSGITWKHDYDTKTLIFSGTGPMPDYTIEEGVVLPWTNYKGKCDVIIVTSGITDIGNCAFMGMTNLTPGNGVKKVFLPGTVKRIGELAFEFLFDLTDVYYEGTKSEWEKIHIEENNTFLTGAKIHCESSEADIYRNGGTSFQWEYDEETRTLTISGKGPMPDYGSGSTPWGSLASKVDRLVINEGISSISGWAFGLFVHWETEDGNVLTAEDGLQTIFLPASLEKIEDCAFFDSSFITDIYYAGSYEEWKLIEIGEDNGSVDRATVHLNGDEAYSVSDEKPNLSIKNETYPENMFKGNPFTVIGEITTDKGVIAMVRGQVLNSSGEIVQSSTYYPYTSSFDLSSTINTELTFGTLDPGYHTYLISAIAENNSISSGETILIEHGFEIYSS